MKRASPFVAVCALAALIFIYAPIAQIVVSSFNTSRYSSTWEGFTFSWYTRLLDNPQAVDAAKVTVLLALISTLIATVLGTLLGYGLGRHRVPGRDAISLALQLPVFIPDIVLAVSLLSLYALLRRWTGFFELGLPAMICAHVTFQIPFVAVLVRARLAGLDPSLEEAARDLGANEWQTFRHVTLPMLFPGVLAGALLAFTLSLDDFVVSFFTSGPGSTTLPIYIYSSVKRGATPDIHALSTLIIAFSFLATLCLSLLAPKLLSARETRGSIAS